ncbi:MAG TPA: sulfatase-like hydrolase/transferase [Planctomycetaceae bacterium]|nr:sulfatase-like hydrolase/transferase [Planctomycetaceae bacterium]
MFILCGFAFTVPILTALASQPVYIHDQQFGWAEIGTLLIGLTICLPLAFVLADRLALAISKRLLGRGRNTVFFGLFVLILLSISRPYISARWIALTGFAGCLAILLSLIGAAIAVTLYEKSRWMRFWLTMASVGLVVFPGAFLREFYSIQRSEVHVDQTIVASLPTHVVMVVFDEFSATTLLNGQMEIDARRFPNFARLAKTSTFYRNATTVHPRTNVAVPAILSGRFPETDLPPLAANYPGNLFQTIKATNAFDMAVFEPVSRLCPKLAEYSAPQPTTLRKTERLIRTLSAIYPRLIMADDLSAHFPAIPREWIALDNEGTSLNWDHFTEGLFYYGADDRARQLAHFLNCIKSSARARFTFLHAELPHSPWIFFPTGQQYSRESPLENHFAGAVGGLGEDWLSDAPTIHRNEFRYRLQVGYVDHFVGRLLDRLIETKVWKKCLLIVTADHGVSFRPGHSRRMPDADNLADIASVPLFIKLPDQKEGRIDDRNVESVDILPTIAETLGIELSEPVDGIPVSQERRRPRKTLYYNKSMTIIEPDLPQRRAAVLRQVELFGQDDLEKLPPRIATHPEWHGRGIASFAVERKPVQATLIDPLLDRTGEESSQHLLQGEIDGSELPRTPAELIVTVDGIVRDSGMTFPLDGNPHGFEFLLPKSVVHNASNIVRLYLINRSQDPPSLRPVAKSSEDFGSQSVIGSGEN